jgi:N-acetyl-anhydromuramyl-L-alanine amidase AmpD
MGLHWIRENKPCVISVFYLIAFLLFFPGVSNSFTPTDRARFQSSIIDYRNQLNPKFTKIKRKRTKYIIVHTSELGLKSTLRVVSSGKRFRNGRRTHGGHAHYVIARDGRTYRIMDKKNVADHAGLSMWRGETDLSKISIGIELAGYHYAPLSDHQYRSVGLLIEILQRYYNLDDLSVLTHSQIAYGPPNRWFKKNHRGRKRCAKNFVRAKAELGPTLPYDPDVAAKRLLPDEQLAEVFYARRNKKIRADEANIISKVNTAWNIAGEDYNSSTTIYKFPNGQLSTGAQIDMKNGWNRIPVDTVVLLNQENKTALIKNKGPVKTISDGLTAWSLAGKSYNKKTTIYFLPSGRIKTGATISEWDNLPLRTRMIIGYKGPYKLSKKQSAYHVAGKYYKDQRTIYYFPSNKMLRGNEIRDFRRLKSGTLIFIPVAI